MAFTNTLLSVESISPPYYLTAFREVNNKAGAVYSTKFPPSRNSKLPNVFHNFYQGTRDGRIPEANAVSHLLIHISKLVYLQTTRYHNEVGQDNRFAQALNPS